MKNKIPEIRFQLVYINFEQVTFIVTRRRPKIVYASGRGRTAHQILQDLFQIT